ncbi:conserved hypothetical protein [Gammaproteobacteria bacterium]
MQNNPLFYKEVVPLDRSQHSDLFLAPRGDYRYAADTNSVFMATVEFARACREYPIVFGKDGQTTFPLAILGLREGENLFVTAAGGWSAAYVPAYVRRYPFILSTQPDSDTLTVCIDSADSSFNNERRGLALFENGVESAFLKNSVDFLKDFQVQYAASIQIATRIEELGILEAMQANVELKTGSRMNIGGFLVVNRQRLFDLSAEQLAGLVRDGILELIYLHLHSMDNFSYLVERLATHPTGSLVATPTAGSA